MAHAAPENLPQLSGISQALRPITITRANMNRFARGAATLELAL